MNIYEKYITLYGLEGKVHPDGHVDDHTRSLVLQKMGYTKPLYDGWTELSDEKSKSIINVSASQLHCGTSKIWIRPSTTPGAFYIDICTVKIGDESKTFFTQDITPQELDIGSKALVDISKMKEALFKKYESHAKGIIETPDGRLFLKDKPAQKVYAFFADGTHLDLYAIG